MKVKQKIQSENESQSIPCYRQNEKIYKFLFYFSKLFVDLENIKSLERDLFMQR